MAGRPASAGDRRATADPGWGGGRTFASAPPHERPRRRRRGARGPLIDRAGVVETGLRLVDAEGVEALTLRRLAGELGVTPMAVYWHVRDKAELLDLIGERVFDAIPVPPPVGDWRDQLRDIHRAMLGALLDHPNAVDLMIGRARFGPAGIALFERILEVLGDAGLGPQAALDAYQALYLFQLGFAATARRSPAFRSVQDAGAAHLRSLDAAQFPAIARVAPLLGRRPLEEQHDVGLRVVIEGIAAALVAGGGRHAPRSMPRGSPPAVATPASPPRTRPAGASSRGSRGTLPRPGT